jgi:hypothetical protein
MMSDENYSSKGISIGVKNRLPHSINKSNHSHKGVGGTGGFMSDMLELHGKLKTDC